MQFAVFSDSHDNFYNLEQAMSTVAERGITEGIHLGDFCAPGFVRAMTAYEQMRWTCVWGNVDGAKTKILLENKDNERFGIGEESFREFDTPDGKIFLTHFPLLARNAAETGKYRAAFYGDNHTKHAEVLENKSLLANPGELAGFKTGQPSFGIWDSATNKFEHVDLDDFRVTK